MRLLVDTHVFLWCVLGDARLPRVTQKAVVDRTNEVFVSAVSAWEISLKAALGKLPLPTLAADWFQDSSAKMGLVALPIQIEHALAAGALPLRHRDPFDRMLIAQARHEGLTLVTVDPVFKAYDVPLVFG